METINVTVQDFDEEVVIKLLINSNMTVAGLKEKLSEEYEIPTENQIWIIDDKIASDTNEIRKGNASFHVVVVDCIDFDEPIELPTVQPTVLLGPFKAVAMEHLVTTATRVERGDTTHHQWPCVNCLFLNSHKRKVCALCLTVKKERHNSSSSINDISKEKNTSVRKLVKKFSMKTS